MPVSNGCWSKESLPVTTQCPLCFTPYFFGLQELFKEVTCYVSIPWLKHSVILTTENTCKTNPVASQLIFWLNYVSFPLQSIFSIFISLRMYTHAYIIGCDLVFFLFPPDLAKDRDLSRTKGDIECKKVLEEGKAELEMEESISSSFLKTLIISWSLCCGR